MRHVDSTHRNTAVRQEELSPEAIKAAVKEAVSLIKKKLGLPATKRFALPPVRFRPNSGRYDSLRGLYHPERREFRFTLPIHAGAPSTVVIGEEVTHFIHHSLRPEVFRERATVIRKTNKAIQSGRPTAYYDLWRIYNYTEAVGLYGGLTLTEELHGAEAVNYLFSSGLHLHPPRIYLDAAYRPIDRKLAAPVRDMGIKYATGYALATLAFAKGSRRHLRFRKLFWMDPAGFEDILPKYDAVPRLFPGFRWKSESEVRAERSKELEKHDPAKA